MSNEIEKFDPSRLMDGVRDRIKATFVSLIPEDQWEQMIKKEIDNFFGKKDYYRQNRDYTNFENICNKVFAEICENKVKEFLAAYTSNTWSNNAPIVSDDLKKMLIEKAPEIFLSILGGAMQNVINNMAAGFNRPVY